MRNGVDARCWAGCGCQASFVSATGTSRRCNCCVSSLFWEARRGKQQQIMAAMLKAWALRTRSQAARAPLSCGARLMKLLSDLKKCAGILLVPTDDGVGAHIGQRLDGQRRIEAAALRREGRAADHEQVRHVPGLA